MTLKKGDSYSDIPNYIRHYVESTERGHIIKILTKVDSKHSIVSGQTTKDQTLSPKIKIKIK